MQAYLRPRNCPHTPHKTPHLTIFLREGRGSKIYSKIKVFLISFLLFSLGLNFSLQSKSWPKAEHYIHHHPKPTRRKLFLRVLDLEGGKCWTNGPRIDQVIQWQGLVRLADLLPSPPPTKKNLIGLLSKKKQNQSLTS